MQRLPLLRRQIEEAGSFSDLCRELLYEFWNIYGRADIIGSRITHSPQDDALLQGIHDYAGWCLLQRHHEHFYGEIVLGFYYGLSVGINVYYAQEFSRYMAPDVLDCLHKSGLLAYIVGRNKVEAFVSDYYAERRKPG